MMMEIRNPSHEKQFHEKKMKKLGGDPVQCTTYIFPLSHIMIIGTFLRPLSFPNLSTSPSPLT